METGEYRQIQIMIFIAFAILVLIMADAVYCVLTNGSVRWHAELIYQSFAMSIPILFVVSLIIRLIRPQLNFYDILITLYVPVLLWWLMIMPPS